MCLLLGIQGTLRHFVCGVSFPIDDVDQVAKRDRADQPFRCNGVEQLGAEHVEIPRRPETVGVVAKALRPGLGEGVGQCRREDLQCRPQPPQRNPDLMDELHRLVRLSVRRAGDIALPLADARSGQGDEGFLDRQPALQRRVFRTLRLRVACFGDASVLVLNHLAYLGRSARSH